MADISFSEDILIFLICIIIIQAAIIFGGWITDISHRIRITKRIFHGFNGTDFTRLIIFSLVGLFVFVFLRLLRFAFIQFCFYTNAREWRS